MNLLTTIMICSMFQDNGIVNAMIQKGSNQNPLMVTVVSTPGEPGIPNNHLKTVAEATAFTKAQLKEGKHVEIGMLQIPSGWLDRLSKNGVTIESLFRSCKNIAVGTDLLNQSAAYCATKTDTTQERNLCALSFYKTGSTGAGMDYAHAILDYAAITPFQSNPAATKIDYNAYSQSKAFRLPSPVFDADDEKASDDDAQSNVDGTNADDVASSDADNSSSSQDQPSFDNSQGAVV